MRNFLVIYVSCKFYEIQGGQHSNRRYESAVILRVIVESVEKLRRHMQLTPIVTGVTAAV